MTLRGSRRGASNLTPVLMILSFLCMAGLLVWLGKSSEALQQSVVMDEGGETEDPAATAAPVTLSQLIESAQTFVGQTVVIENAPVTSQVGRGSFLVGGEGAVPGSVLVMIGSDLITSGVIAPAAGSFTIIGTVREKSETDVDDWVGMSLIPESQRATVDPSTHWIDALEIRASEAEPASGGDSEAGGS